MSGRPTNLIKNHSKDRTLVLKPIEGADVLNSKGMVDKNLFTGKNELHALMDEEYGHWSVQYKDGIIPPAFKQKWTSFAKLHKFVSEYYRLRNIQITDIIDN